MKQSLFTMMMVFLLVLPAPAQERIKFPVGGSSKVFGYGHLWAAWRRGFFEREGLDVDVVVIRGTGPAVQALVADSIATLRSKYFERLELFERL